MRTVLFAFLMLINPFASAQHWAFSPAIEVTKIAGPGVFHHLDSSGRRSIAVSEATVAIAWEDNRSGNPAIYLARKKLHAKQFESEIKINVSPEAYEPSILAMDDNRFIVAWESDSKILARAVTATSMGPIITVSKTDGVQVSLARNRDKIYLVYSSMEKKYQQIWLQQLRLNGQKLEKINSCPLEKTIAKDHQFYPSITITGNILISAWEDRRPGHTVIMAAKSTLGTPCSFSDPQQVSDPPRQRSAAYGKGHGVARVTLAAFGKHVIAVWADKRDFREGYDIYSARYTGQNKSMFGANQKVQDSFGGIAQQWHASVAGNRAGQLIVFWDDNRDGDASITYSRPGEKGWSDDSVVSDENSLPHQTHPSVTLDEKGNAYLVWIDRKTKNGSTRLRYAEGKFMAE